MSSVSDRGKYRSVIEWTRNVNAGGAWGRSGKGVSFDMDEMPWPRKGDVVFGPSHDWQNNACLNFMTGPNAAELYAMGYRKGAECLSDYVLSTNRHQDSLVYPIVYMWRHYVELRLKEMMRTVSALLDDQTEKNLNHHRLQALWTRLRPLIEEIWLDADPEPLDAVEEIVSQLDQVDKSSIAFRYPTDKHGGPSLPDGLYYVNIRNLSEVMQRVGNFLDTVDAAVCVYLDQKRDMERDYRPDFDNRFL